MQYTPTVYEQIVIDLVANKQIDFNNYKNEWELRGYKEDDFNQYLADAKYALGLTNAPDYKLMNAVNQAKEEVKDREDIVTFKLTEDEKNIVLFAEDMGRIKKDEVIKYDGYDREIKGVDYLDLPANADALVIFSGHPGSGSVAVKSWFNDYKKNGKPKKLIFLGLHDNQGNTDFSDKSLKFNTRSEVEMYIRYFKACGVPKEVIKQCLVRPKDISTAENIQLLSFVRNKFFDKNKDANFVMFGYPAYQKRIASEFAFGFQALEDNKEVAGTNFYIPDAPVSINENERYLSYDNLNGIAQDIIVGNCMAHPYRVSAGGRFDSKLGQYPKQFKSLLNLSLVYSYPNVANELAGTDEKVASVMKILRGMQHKVKKWEDAKVVDAQIKKNAIQTRKDLLNLGLISNDNLSQRGKNKLAKYTKWFDKLKTR